LLSNYWLENVIIQNPFANATGPVHH